MQASTIVILCLYALIGMALAEASRKAQKAAPEKYDGMNVYGWIVVAVFWPIPTCWGILITFRKLRGQGGSRDKESPTIH